MGQTVVNPHHKVRKPSIDEFLSNLENGERALHARKTNAKSEAIAAILSGGHKKSELTSEILNIMILRTRSQRILSMARMQKKSAICGTPSWAISINNNLSISLFLPQNSSFLYWLYSYSQQNTKESIKDSVQKREGFLWTRKGDLSADWRKS